MRPALDDAVLLAVRCFHRDYENSWERPVHIEDVTRAVARIYGLPDQEPTQIINEWRLREDNLFRRDGQKLNLATGDTVISLEKAVEQNAFELRAKGLLNLGFNELQLTKAGSDKAESIERSQWIVDTGIVTRIQEYDRSRTKTKLREAFRDRERELKRGRSLDDGYYSRER